MCREIQIKSFTANGIECDGAKVLFSCFYNSDSLSQIFPSRFFFVFMKRFWHLKSVAGADKRKVFFAVILITGWVCHRLFYLHNVSKLIANASSFWRDDVRNTLQQWFCGLGFRDNTLCFGLIYGATLVQIYLDVIKKMLTIGTPSNLDKIYMNHWAKCLCQIFIFSCRSFHQLF
jgi:hypothetical protein